MSINHEKANRQENVESRGLQVELPIWIAFEDWAEQPKGIPNRFRSEKHF